MSGYWGGSGLGGTDHSDPSTSWGSHEYAVTKYVVDSNECNEAPYRTLHDAMVDALSESKNSCQAPTILLRPGEYELTDVFESRQKVNIVGTSFGSQQSPVVRGCTESGGNKGWYGVKFMGSESHYVVNNRKSCDKDISHDLFSGCQFTDNFKVTAFNDIAKFTNCYFNYDSLDRDKVLEVADGNGAMEFHKSEFNFCRSGSSCATSMIFLGSNTCTTNSLFHTNVFRGSVEGQTTFSMIRPHGNQPIHFMFGYINISKAQPKTYLFGAHNKTCNISLSIKSSQFHGPECCNNVALAANLWPQLKSHDPIIFDCNKLQNMRAMWYGDTDCNGRPEEIPNYKCSSDGSYLGSTGGCGCKKKKKSSCKSGGCKKKKKSGCGGGGCGGGTVRIMVQDAECETTTQQCCPQPDADIGDVRFIWTHNQIIPSAPSPFSFVKMEMMDSLTFRW